MRKFTILIFLSLFSCVNKNVSIYKKPINLNISNTYEYLKVVSDHHNANIKQIKALKYNDYYYIATIDESGKILVRRHLPGTFSKPRLLFKAKSNKSKMALSLDYNYVALNTNGKTEIFDVLSNKKVIQTFAVRAPILDLSFEENSRAVLISSADTHVYRYKFIEAKNCKKLSCQNFMERYTGHGSVVSGAKHLADTPVMFSGDWEGRVLVWKFYDSEIESKNFNANLFANRFFSKNANNVQFRKKDNDPVTKFAINQNKTLMAVSFRSGFVEIWKIRGAEKLIRFKAEKGAVNSLSFSNNGLMLTTADNESLSIWLTADMLNKAKDSDLNFDSNSNLDDQMDKGHKNIKALKEIDYPGLTTQSFMGDYNLLVADKSNKLKTINLRGLYSK